MSLLRDKVKSVIKLYVTDEQISKFYTIKIPSLGMEKYINLATIPSSSVKDLPKNDCIYQMSLTADECALPPRLQGQVPPLFERDALQQENEWILLMRKSHGFGAIRGTSMIANVISSIQGQQSSDRRNFKPYSSDVCATPGCDRTIPAAKRFDHLNLCDEHQSKLDALLKRYQKSHDIILPSNMSSDDIHNMVYYSLLPDIDKYLQQLSSSNNEHSKYVEQALKAFKACIYLYRMHLNGMPDFIQTIIGLFLKALGQSETTMKQLVSSILKLVLVAFAICGIFLIWTADLILSDDRHLSIALMAAGGGLGIWGWLTLAAAATVIAGPIAAIAAGVALFGIGLSMFIERLYRKAPHEYCVRAHVDLNNVRDFLRQWIGSAFPE